MGSMAVGSKALVRSMVLEDNKDVGKGCSKDRDRSSSQPTSLLQRLIRLERRIS